MSPAPATSGSAADELYERLRPLAHRDEFLGWSLLHYVSAAALPLQLVEDLIRDTDDGPGWSAMLDPDRCPTWALGWLGQFVGVRLLPREPFETEAAWEAAMRDRIKRTDGQHRGSPEALRAAAQRYLTGSKYVIVNERVGGDAWELGVVTLIGETPDAGAVLRALLEQKPAGVRLTHTIVPGHDYDAIAAGWDDYDDLALAFATYDDLQLNTP